MGKPKRKQPAPYSTTDEGETLAVTILRSLLDHAKVRFNFEERDKGPNTDGYIELVNEFRVPISKLEVQIRKIRDYKRTIQCPLTLISYSETTCNPVLLVGVDTKQNKAYWVHVRADLITDLAIRSKQKTKAITFPIENMIDGKNKGYINEWKKIHEVYQTRIREYPNVRNELLELLKRSNPALGVNKKDFRNIHLFLDKINTLLDGEFSVVKRVLYPNTWKVGLAYSRYEDDSVSYSLYPIFIETNDVQIKEADPALGEKLWKQGIGIRGHNFENPIKVRPRKYAIEIVESKTLRLLKDRPLSHAGNEFLARESIFAFIDRYFQSLGLEKKDEYSVSEIEKAFDRFLPMSIDPYTRATAEISMGHYRFRFGVFQEFLSFLKSNAFEETSRVYVKKDFSRLQKGGLVYHLYSPEAIETNLRIFFDNLHAVYKNIVSINFPRIADELPLYADTSRVIVFFDAKEKYESLRDAPTIDSFYLKSEDQHDLEIEVYRAEERERFSDLSRDSWRKDIEIDGKKYTLVSWSMGILDFIYDEFPMFNFVYKILEKNLKHYFNNLREKQQ